MLDFYCFIPCLRTGVLIFPSSNSLHVLIIEVISEFWTIVTTGKFMINFRFNSKTFVFFSLPGISSVACAEQEVGAGTPTISPIMPPPPPTYADLTWPDIVTTEMDAGMQNCEYFYARISLVFFLFYAAMNTFSQLRIDPDLAVLTSVTRCTRYHRP